MKRTFIIFFAVSICLFHIKAEPLCHIKHFSVDDGLAQGFVTSILQDQKGYLWFSSRNGLSKFDGYTFRNYKAYPGDGCSLKSNRIISIRENASGDIWCHEYDHRLFLFDRKEERFIDVSKPIEKHSGKTVTIKSLFPLKKKITWLTCENGQVFRIDERKCKGGVRDFFTTEESLNNKVVLNVVEDKDGDEWVFTNKGVTIFGEKVIRDTTTFRHFIELEKRIWLLSQNGHLARYEKNGTVTFIQIPYPLSKIYTMADLGSSEMAIGTDIGLILFNTKNSTFQYYDLKDKRQTSSDVVSINQDSKGMLWLYTEGSGIVRLNRANGTCKLFVSPNMWVKSGNRFFVNEDTFGNIWMVPRDGELCYFDTLEDRPKLYEPVWDESTPFFTPDIRKYFMDNQGNLWIATNNDLIKLTSLKRHYSLIKLFENTEIRAILLDRSGNLWLASKAGHVWVFNSDRKFLGAITGDGRMVNSSGAFCTSGVYAFLQDREGRVWIGTKGEGLYRLDPDARNSKRYVVRHFVHNTSDAYSLSDDNIYSIFQDSRGHIWVGSFGGGVNQVVTDPSGSVRFFNKNNRLKNYPKANALKVRYLTEAKDGVLMAGTNDGLLTFSSSFRKPEDLKFFFNTRNPDDASSLSNSDVLQIFNDVGGSIYVITFSGGINRVLSKNLLSDKIAFRSYTEKEGLASDLTMSMIRDRWNKLWIISEKALTCFNPKTEKFENFNRHCLLKDFNFSEAIPVLSRSGTILIGTDKGLMEVTPNLMKKSTYVPPIAFAGLLIQGGSQWEPIDDLQRLELKPSQRNVTFQYAALDFIDSEEIRYAYRLDGLEKEWHYVEKSRSATYNNLPHGSFEFQVRSTNSDGVWVDNVRTLPVEVVPTFWETIWAYLLYLILFIVFVLVIVYIVFYIYRLKLQVDFEHKLSDIKFNFFTDISHELRTPLTLISSPISEVLENEQLTPMAKEHLTLVQRNTKRMLQLVNQILDFSKIQNKKMKIQVEMMDVLPVITILMDNFRLIAEQNKIEFSLHTELKELMLWVDKDKFEKIFFNLISNAFEFTPSGKSIHIKILEQESTVSISVVDEGIGINPDKIATLFQRFETLAEKNMLQPSSGIGLSLVKELVCLHHGQIEVFSKLGRGSEFRVCFLKGCKHFENEPDVEFLLTDSVTADSVAEENLEVEEESESVERLTILIVEDNVELKRFLKNILSVNYLVLEAKNGQEGLEKAMEHIPDIIISDLMMPVMDGLDMVRKIKEGKDISHIPIIILSAKSTLDDRIDGLEYGIDDFIPKPFNSAYLKARVKALIQKRREIQEYYRQIMTNTTPEGLLSPSRPPVRPYDELFLRQMMEFMEKNIDNTSLVVEDFAENCALSRTVFYRKLKSVVGLTPVEFIRDFRIKRAVQLIETGEFSFSQVAYMTGFNDPKYFGKCFKKYTGLTLIEYKNKEKGQ
jgi:signal transduction histidine kinase/ligand-binding sensor domain-containing protein/DNA-binding response OmpR family regulator